MRSCPVRRNGQVCAPINEVLVSGGADATLETYAACSCGRRFPLSRTAAQRLGKVIAGYRAAPTATADPAEARRLDSLIERTTCPTGRVSPLSKQGIVPIGTPVLHRSTEPVTVISTGLARFGLHMVSAMRRAKGIGLAANQVGVPVRVLAHNLGRVLPQIMVNPKVTRSQGRWTYGEGCLSLRIEGTAVDVVRPRIISVVATLLDGRVIAVRADELLARVLQHELDHLDGIEYVQRLVGAERAAVYALIEQSGGDLSFLPPRPYDR
ncbi:peptide deformylase [Streptomyces sp. NBC_00080]|uniref:peptide deformylase n=1 Tax=Streptomyces sp. NBC_00080 TaxID=2975645 RepID=UPI00324D9252